MASGLAVGVHLYEEGGLARGGAAGVPHGPVTPMVLSKTYKMPTL
jgi:hypothetical protein